MHLIVPHAGTVSDAGRQALQTLALPQLERVLGRLRVAATRGSDEFSLSAPHELVYAAERGWPQIDGALPWAAELAAGLAENLAPSGLLAGDPAWALLSPVHLHLGPEQVSLTDPATLSLTEADSRALLDAVRDLFASEGFGLHWAAPQQWLATHPLFDGLATASLDRVIGRNIDAWLPQQDHTRLLRRLQNEVQMRLYGHPVNERREAAGLLAINSFWYSGCGRARPASKPRYLPTIDERLCQPALSEDWAAWCEAWAALDDGPMAVLAAQLSQADDAADPPRLTLCGERRALRWEPAARSLWQRVSGRWQRGAAAAVLESL